MNSKASDGGRVEGEGVDVASNPSDPSKGALEGLAAEIEAGGGTNEAVALALGWHRRLMLEEVTPEDCDRDEHVSYMEVPWWRGPNGERKQYLPPAFLTDLNALAAECECRKWDISMHTDGGCPYAAVTTCDGRVLDSAINDAPTLARALCAALVRAVEAGNAQG